MYKAGADAGKKACYSGQDALRGSFRQSKSDIGPGPALPPKAPPPSSKGSIKKPEQVGR